MTRVNRMVWSLNGGELFAAYSLFDNDDDLDAANLLFKLEPPELPGVSMTLKAKVALNELGAGRHELGFEFALTGFDARRKPKLYLDAGARKIDSRVVHDALATGINPILAVLVNQPDVASEFFDGAPDDLHAWVGQQALESSVPAAKKARAADAGRL